MRLHLPASHGESAAGIARRAAPPGDEDLALVVTELVSNAVRHAGGDILLVIEDTGGMRRVEVWDTSSQPPRMQAGALDAESGRGLLLVDTLSRTWGWSASRGTGPWAKTVFAEMTAPRAAAAPNGVLQ
jgi:anti-sigma regulatory factor (Ser/Thr protein kinase)